MKHKARFSNDPTLKDTQPDATFAHMHTIKDIIRTLCPVDLGRLSLKLY
jgi:hypothetical protein